MKTIPYSCQDITLEDVEAVCNVLRSKFVTQGPAIAAFEQAFGYRHEVANCVAVSNATAALHIACLALDVGPGSKVWTSPNSFISSANCAVLCGAEIDFVDIDPCTRNMSVKALEDKLLRASTIGSLPKVVIPVDFGGLPCDMREMRLLADTYGFSLLEDASHAVGASYLERPVGSVFADISIFSFHAVKIVTTAEGGMVTTQNDALANRLRLLRSHGMTRNPLEFERQADGPWYYEQQLLGFNYRMTDLQAALGLSQLGRLDAMHSRREELATRYNCLLAELPILLPVNLTDRRSSWHLYAVEIDDTRTSKTRAQVYSAMRSLGIGVNVHYIPIHTQPFYSRRGFKRGDFPASERYYDRTISIPLFPRLTNAEQEFVVQSLSNALS